ncbi:MAG: DUF4394 domain-containing protein [Armatimonadetes bacterium]|nr:DUF4394 domain-containing protein [Armatimonadota bacterium]
MRTQNQYRILALAMVLGSGVAQASTIYGLTSRDHLIRFDSMTPNTLAADTMLWGQAANEMFVGIDFRPATNQLYGVGSYGNLYTINTMNGMATKVATIMDSSNNPITLMGSEFGVDFNPTVDRLRITSNLGMNLRVNPVSGSTIVDGNLNMGGGTPYIVASAYSNNDNDSSTGTTLYNIDSASDMLTIQTPPNNGTQVNVGALGYDVTALAGLDIETMGTSNMAYAALQSSAANGSWLASINLSTGAASVMGSIGSAQTSDSIAVRDIAVQTVPEPATMAALVCGIGALLRRKRSA